ncbi:unnamed protein product, partial [Symbiodinium sp. KB8]
MRRYCPFGDESRPSYLSQVCWGFLRQLVEPSAQRATAATALATNPEGIRRAWLFNHVRSIASGTIRSAMSFRESFTKCCDAIGRKQDACAGFLASWCSIGGYRLVFNAPLTLWFEGICLLVWAIKSAHWGDFSVFVAKLFQSPTRYQVLHITYYPLTPLRLFLHVFGHADWKHFF